MYIIGGNALGDKIRIGIVGYGNVGKGVRLAAYQNPDMELVAIFTRRDVNSINIDDTSVKVVNVLEAESFKDTIDVMILCGGSATDLVEQGPYFAKMFNTVDSFDTHAKIPEYFDAVDKSAQMGENTSLISGGWDPGLFSLNRVMAEAILPRGRGYTFWGPGVSLGHSDAIRRIEGVKDAVQYTIPKESAVESIRKGNMPKLTNGDRHVRDCYVVIEEGADKAEIENKIKTMKNYFAEYETQVTFITEEELKCKHGGLPHGGLVIHSGVTGADEENISVVEYSLNLGSNAEFTASVLIAYARAVYRLNREGVIGAKTVLDIPPAYLSHKSDEELRRNLL